MPDRARIKNGRAGDKGRIPCRGRGSQGDVGEGIVVLGREPAIDRPDILCALPQPVIHPLGEIEPSSLHIALDDQVERIGRGQIEQLLRCWFGDRAHRLDKTLGIVPRPARHFLFLDPGQG